ncbi:MAG TPA: serine hydrolase [Tepidisphaeraceae bacterium]|nr:serine hydrolase [Tepidisphaeraceae bacterium]
MSRALALLALLTLPAAAVPGEADKIRALAAPYVDGGWVRSVVVGVVDKTGAPRVYGFGELSGTDKRAPDGRTVFEIASVTKTFTALLLAEMSERGELKFEDTLEAFLPAEVKLPDTDKQITLERLATHHSGLPRLPHNLFPAPDPNDPYAAYTVGKLYAFLPAARVHPTEKFVYSNVAYGLLGHALARRAKTDYEPLLIDRVCKPLGMNETTIKLDAGLRARLAPPFDADLEPDHEWDLGAIPAGGALHSTAGDLLRYLRAHLESPAGVPKSLAAALGVVQQPRDTADHDLQICLAWHRAKDGRLVHNGQTGGYHSYVVLDPKAGIGVVVLANTATMRADAIGDGALRVARGLAPAKPNLPVAIALPAATLDKYAGKYKLPENGGSLLVVRDEDRLLTRAPNQPARRIYPRTETEFFAKATSATGTFEMDDAGKVTALRITQDGKTYRATR